MKSLGLMTFLTKVCNNWVFFLDRGGLFVIFWCFVHLYVNRKGFRKRSRGAH